MWCLPKGICCQTCSTLTFSYFRLLHWSPTTRKLVLLLTSPENSIRQQRQPTSAATMRPQQPSLKGHALLHRLQHCAQEDAGPDCSYAQQRGRADPPPPVTRAPWLSTRSFATSRNRLGSTPENTNVLPVKASGWPRTTSCRQHQQQHGMFCPPHVCGKCLLHTCPGYTNTNLQDHHQAMVRAQGTSVCLLCPSSLPWSLGWVVGAPPQRRQRDPTERRSSCRQPTAWHHGGHGTIQS